MSSSEESAAPQAKSDALQVFSAKAAVIPALPGQPPPLPPRQQQQVTIYHQQQQQSSQGPQSRPPPLPLGGVSGGVATATTSSSDSDEDLVPRKPRRLPPPPVPRRPSQQQGNSSQAANEAAQRDHQHPVSTWSSDGDDEDEAPGPTTRAPECEAPVLGCSSSAHLPGNLSKNKLESVSPCRASAVTTEAQQRLLQQQQQQQQQPRPPRHGAGHSSSNSVSSIALVDSETQLDSVDSGVSVTGSDNESNNNPASATAATTTATDGDVNSAASLMVSGVVVAGGLQAPSTATAKCHLDCQIGLMVLLADGQESSSRSPDVHVLRKEVQESQADASSAVSLASSSPPSTASDEPGHGREDLEQKERQEEEKRLRLKRETKTASEETKDEGNNKKKRNQSAESQWAESAQQARFEEQFENVLPLLRRGPSSDGASSASFELEPSGGGRTYQRTEREQLDGSNTASSSAASAPEEEATRFEELRFANIEEVVQQQQRPCSSSPLDSAAAKSVLVDTVTLSDSDHQNSQSIEHLVQLQDEDEAHSAAKVSIAAQFGGAPSSVIVSNPNFDSDASHQTRRRRQQQDDQEKSVCSALPIVAMSVTHGSTRTEDMGEDAVATPQPATPSVQHSLHQEDGPPVRPIKAIAPQKLKGLLKKSWSECGTETTDGRVPESGDKSSSRTRTRKVTFSETMMVFCDDWPIELMPQIVALKSPGDFNLVEVAAQGYMFEPPAEYQDMLPFDPPLDYRDIIAAVANGGSSDNGSMTHNGNGFAYIDGEHLDKTSGNQDIFWESMILNDKEMIEEDAIIGVLKEDALLQAIGSHVDNVFHPPPHENLGQEDFPVHYLSAEALREGATSPSSSTSSAFDQQAPVMPGLQHLQGQALSSPAKSSASNDNSNSEASADTFSEADDLLSTNSPTLSLQDMASDSSFTSQDTIIMMTNALINGSNKALGLSDGDLILADDGSEAESVDTVMEMASSDCVPEMTAISEMVIAQAKQDKDVKSDLSAAPDEAGSAVQFGSSSPGADTNSSRTSWDSGEPATEPGAPPPPPIRSSVPTSMSVSEIRKAFERNLALGNAVLAGSGSSGSTTTSSSSSSSATLPNQRPKSFPSSSSSAKDVVQQQLLKNAGEALASLSVQEQLRWLASVEQNPSNQNSAQNAAAAAVASSRHPLQNSTNSNAQEQPHQQSIAAGGAASNSMPSTGSNSSNANSGGAAQAAAPAANTGSKNWPSEDLLIEYTTEPRALVPSKRTSSVSNFHPGVVGPQQPSQATVAPGQQQQQPQQLYAIDPINAPRMSPMYLSLNRRDPHQVFSLFNPNQNSSGAGQQQQQQQQTPPQVPPRMVPAQQFVGLSQLAAQGHRVLHVSPAGLPIGVQQQLQQQQQQQQKDSVNPSNVQPQLQQRPQLTPQQQQQIIQHQILLQQQQQQLSHSQTLPRPTAHHQLGPILIQQQGQGHPGHVHRYSTNCGPVYVQQHPAGQRLLIAHQAPLNPGSAVPGTGSQQPPQSPRHLPASHAQQQQQQQQQHRQIHLASHQQQILNAALVAQHHQNHRASLQEFPNPSEIRRRDGLNAFPHVWEEPPKPGALPVPPANLLEHQNAQLSVKDELEAFVQQDSDRIERIKKRYSMVEHQQLSHHENGQGGGGNSDDPTFGFGKRPAVRGIKPKMMSNHELLKQMQAHQVHPVVQHVPGPGGPQTQHVLHVQHAVPQQVGTSPQPGQQPTSAATPGQQRRHVYLIQGGPQYQQRLVQVGATLPRGHSHLHIIQHNPTAPGGGGGGGGGGAGPGGTAVVHQHHIHMKPQQQLQLVSQAGSGGGERPASSLGDVQPSSGQKQQQAIYCYQHHSQPGSAAHQCPKAFTGGPVAHVGPSQLTYKTFSMPNVALIKPIGGGGLTVVPIHPSPKDERGVPEGASSSPKHCSSDSSYGSGGGGASSTQAKSVASSAGNNNPDLVKDITARASCSKSSRDSSKEAAGSSSSVHSSGHHQASSAQGPVPAGQSQTKAQLKEKKDKEKDKASKQEKATKEKADKKSEKEKKKKEKEAAKAAAKEGKTSKEGVIYYSMNV